MPRSMTIKNNVRKATVTRTVIVYLTSSLRPGQLTFRISEATLRKNFVMDMYLRPPSKLMFVVILCRGGWCVRCSACKTSLIPFFQPFRCPLWSCNCANRKPNRQVPFFSASHHQLSYGLTALTEPAAVKNLSRKTGRVFWAPPVPYRYRIKT